MKKKINPALFGFSESNQPTKAKSLEHYFQAIFNEPLNKEVLVNYRMFLDLCEQKLGKAVASQIESELIAEKKMVTSKSGTPALRVNPEIVNKLYDTEDFKGEK
jgi:hypothetical protein